MARRFCMPPNVYIGTDCFNEAISYLCTLGSHALIVTGRSMQQQGHLRTLTLVLESRQIAYTIFSGITGEPTDTMIAKGADCYKNSHCDFIIGFGGGSPLDSAKAIGVLVASGGRISDYCGTEITTPIPPLVAIPSTAGPGSEVTQFTIITDTVNDVKMLLKGPALVPDVAIVDPTFSMQMPHEVAVSTGLDALTHAIEAYTSRKAFDLSDMYALSAIQRIFRYMPAAISENDAKEARIQMALAAFEAGVSFSNSSVTLVHGMSRPIGALFHVPHGLSNAMLLEVCMSFAADGATDRFAALGRAIGMADAPTEDTYACQKFIEALRALCLTCHVPSLSEYGVNREQFLSQVEKMATDAIASGSPGNTRKPISKNDICRIYRSLMD